MKKDHQGLAINTTPPNYLTDCNRKKERSSNLELYRIVVMLLIVMHHYVVNSGLTDVMEQNPTSVGSIYLYLIGVWGKTCINCFVLITGYFMCQSRITLHKFLKLLLQIEFYSIVIGLTFMVSGYSQFSVRSLIDITNPIHAVGKNFTGCFLLFYLFIPFLNACINHLSQFQHLLLLMLCVFIYTILGSIPVIYIEFNYVTWFSVLYVIASYIRKWHIPYDSSFRFWTLATTLALFVSVMSVALMLFRTNLSDRPTSFSYVAFFLQDSNKVMALIVSVCSFMMFKNMKLKQSSFVNAVAACTFGVLLIHAASDDMRKWLWRDVCNNVGVYQENSIYLHALLVPIAVFCVCAMIDYVRQKTIEQPLLDGVERLINKVARKYLVTCNINNK